MAKSLQIDTKNLKLNVDKFDKKIDRGITAAFDYQASRSEFFMKSNASWTDRTGNARNGLYAATKHTKKHHSMLLSHSVPYGIWLEVRFSGRYEIIIPALNYTVRELRSILSKLFGSARRA